MHKKERYFTHRSLTRRARTSGLRSAIEDRLDSKTERLIKRLQNLGYEVLFSIGELEENRIGSNCGRYVRRHLQDSLRLENSYDYWGMA